MVLVGFTADGDPVLNDPYAPDDDSVRLTVPRQGSRRSGSGQRRRGVCAATRVGAAAPITRPAELVISPADPTSGRARPGWRRAGVP
ncbi:hypothetical protein NKG94_24125 [Micromonospora sp. M12]